MVNFQYKTSYDVFDLAQIVTLLRAPGGCPWDREQTHESILRNFLEEAYEVAEAIDEGSTEHLKEELGDVLLQVLFHTEIERELGQFDLNAVADGVCKKLIYRHPHVFGECSVSGTGQVLENWETLKRKEKGQDSYADSVDAVARSLPALWRAEKIQKKARKAGFDWDDVSGALDKLEEETAELREAIAEHSNIEEEFGDLLFAAVNTARFLDLDPEQALNLASDKFSARFRRVEELATASGRDMKDMTLAELDKLWNQVKKA
jgi:tetrapyrrole methylase family protein/MazG family protein